MSDEPVVQQIPLREQALEAFRGFMGHGWQLARYIATIAEQEAWREWTDSEGRPFKSLHDYAKHDFSESFAAGNLYHYKQIGTWVESLPQDEAAEWEQVPVSSVIAAKQLLKEPGGRKAILERLQDGATHSQIRQYVAGQLPELHQEAEYRTVVLKHVSEPHYHLWKQAQNLARYRIGKPNPTSDELSVVFATAVLNEPIDLPPEWSTEQRNEYIQSILDGTAVPETTQSKPR